MHVSYQPLVRPKYSSGSPESKVASTRQPCMAPLITKSYPAFLNPPEESLDDPLPPYISPDGSDDLETKQRV